MAQRAEIVEIVAPGGAVAGSRVDFTVKVKNIYSAPLFIKVGGIVFNAPGEFTFPDGDDVYTLPGETHSISGYFTMPHVDAVMRVSSYYYEGGDWWPDDEKEKTVELTTFSELAVTSFQKV